MRRCCASLRLAPTCAAGTFANASEIDGAPECFLLVPSEDVCALLKLIWDHIMGFMDPAAGLGAVTQATPLPAPAAAGLRKLLHRNLEALAPHFAKFVRSDVILPGKPEGTEKTEKKRV